MSSYSDNAPRVWGKMRKLKIGLAPPGMLCYDRNMEITKFDILTSDLAAQREEIALAIAEMEQAERYLNGLDTAPSGCGPCSCGEDISTEGLFSRHFVISHENRFYRHLNLGECPNSAKGKAIIAGASASV